MEHVSLFSLNYGTMEEFNFRHDLFKLTHEKIAAHNNDLTMTSTVGHNFLSTWTAAEKKRIMGYTPSTAPKKYQTLP